MKWICAAPSRSTRPSTSTRGAPEGCGWLGSAFSLSSTASRIAARTSARAASPSRSQRARIAAAKEACALMGESYARAALPGARSASRMKYAPRVRAGYATFGIVALLASAALAEEPAPIDPVPESRTEELPDGGTPDGGEPAQAVEAPKPPEA